MKIKLSSQLASVAVAALLSMPGAAMAQSAKAPATLPQAAAPPAGVAASPSMAQHAPNGKTMQERVEHRINELHAQLKITPAEQKQWDNFAAVMRDNAKAMDDAFMQRAQQYPQMNAVQNMQSYEQIAEAHAQHLQKLVPAFQDLYNAMPDQQKQLADQVFRSHAQRHAEHAQRTHRGRNG
ncbi:MAG TPA: Spy/CpxP family protein refolding chaperone [Stellaceae bacterium]|jgi:hypothetical protein|nr:Spy/CpxP family protein refolding chaperone [Stellaceae bacterium]